MNILGRKPYLEVFLFIYAPKWGNEDCRKSWFAHLYSEADAVFIGQLGDSPLNPVALTSLRH
jgi:hypothetical protein